MLEEILRVKPAAAKGRYLKSVTMASTMGPGLKLDTTKIRDLLEEAADRGRDGSTIPTNIRAYRARDSRGQAQTTTRPRPASPEAPASPAPALTSGRERQADEEVSA